MVADLNKIEFHDLPVNSLRLDFDREEVSLIVSRHDKELNDLIKIELLFSVVANFSIDKMPTLYIEEIYACNLKQNDNVYFIEFIMLYGEPAISVNMSFSFGDVELTVLK